MCPILVIGATGLLGSETCRLLRGSERHVRALARQDSSRTDLLERFGVELIHGDLNDVDSLEEACRGVSTVISASTGVRRRLPGDNLKHVDLEGQRALIDAARRRSVRRFVYVSVSPNLPSTTPLVRAKREIEAALRASDLSWVTVQPSAFMETSFRRGAGFDVAAGRAAVVGSGDAPVSYVSVRDVAKVLAETALADSKGRTHLPVGGPEALTAWDAVRTFQEETGRCFEILHLPARAVRRAGSLLRPLHPELSSLLTLAAHRGEAGDIVETPEEVRRLLPRRTTLREFARDAARAASTKRARLILRRAGETRP